jgi:hypothetical protein
VALRAPGGDVGARAGVRDGEGAPGGDDAARARRAVEAQVVARLLGPLALGAQRRRAAAALRGVEQADVARVEQPTRGVLERRPDGLGRGGGRGLASEPGQGRGMRAGIIGGEQRVAAFYLRLVG